MSERRMFAKAVVEGDSFYMLSTDAQALYLHLAMNADDEGLLNNPRSIMRNCSVGEEVLEELARNGFIVTFESGVVALSHWHVNNKIYRDRRKPTMFREEHSRLNIGDNVYFISKNPEITSGFPHIL